MLYAKVIEKYETTKRKDEKESSFSHNLYTYYIYKPLSLPILEVMVLRILTE